MNVVAYDTGDMTGIGMWRAGEGLGDIWSTALKRAETEEHMRVNIKNADVCIVEKLVITQRSTNDLIPAIELAGVAVHYAGLYDVPVVRQMPADVMRFADDKKLKRIGWYVPGPDHQRDARRHVITWIAEQRLIDLRMLLPEGGI